jgi:hypothetical protein
MQLIFCTVKYFTIFILHIYYQDDQITKDEMGGACSTHEEIINAYKMWLEILKEIGWESMDWIHMAQDNDR